MNCFIKHTLQILSFEHNTQNALIYAMSSCAMNHMMLHGERKWKLWRIRTSADDLRRTIEDDQKKKKSWQADWLPSSQSGRYIPKMEPSDGPKWRWYGWQWVLACQFLHQTFLNFSSSLPPPVSARLSPSGKSSRSTKQLLCSDLATKVFYWEIAWQLWLRIGPTENELLKMGVCLGNCCKGRQSESTCLDDAYLPRPYRVLVY